MQKFDWKRYWTPFGEPVYMDDAFILAPIGDHSFSRNAKLVETAGLPHAGVVVLLGEAGLGKSTELQSIWDHSSGSAFVDLGAFGDEGRLENRLREVFREAPEGSLVILDGLDETLVQVSKAGEVILETLRSVKVSVGVMISCRTAAWPPSLSAKIKDSGWDISQFELCVLSRDDVELAIADSGRKNLWEKIRSAGAESLAAKPTTLAMLISLDENEQIPSTRLGLYEQGLRKLCEQGKERDDRAAIDSPIPSPEECLAIAERVAGRLLLSRHSMVTRVRDRGDAVHYEDLVGGKAIMGIRCAVELTESKIRQTVEHTALFSGRTAGLYGFAHRSFGEFLAARYLKTEFSAAQIETMISVESEGVRKVAPQLNEVAAWLADMDDGFRTRLLGDDPTIILRSDLSSRSASDKIEVAEALLKAVQVDQIYRLEDALVDGPGDRRYGVVGQLLGRLACPELAGVVRSWLADKSRSERARHLAIDIAWSTKCSGLSSELAAIVLDSTEPAWLRHEAGYALKDVGGEADKERLRALLMFPEAEDPRDDLKGIALRVLWPEHLTPLEMLTSLTPRRESSYLGSYGGFLYNIKNMKRLADADLPQALVWAKGIGGDLGAGTDVVSIAGMVAYEAWERMDREGVLEPLADLAVDRMLHHHIFMIVPAVEQHGTWTSEREQACSGVLRRDDQRRRTLIRACLGRLGPKKTHYLINPGMGGTLAVESDFEWAIEQCLQFEGDLAERFAELARSLCIYSGVGPWKNS